MSLNDGKCKYCQRKPELDSSGHYWIQDNTECLAVGLYTSMNIGVDRDGNVIMVGFGDDHTKSYYPNFCPECGRKLRD